METPIRSFALKSWVGALAAAVALATSVNAFAADKIHQGYSATADQYEVDGVVVSNVDTSAPLWNPRGKSEEQLAERAKFLGEAYDLVRTEEQLARAEKYKEKYRDAVYVNSVMLGSVGMIEISDADFAKGLKRNLDAGGSAVSVTAYAYPGDGETALLDRLDLSKKVIDANDDFVMIDGVESIRQAKKDGKIAVLFNTQGAEWAIEDLSQLDEFHKRGVRVTNLIYNNDNAFAGGGSEQLSGLTELGASFVKKANEMGVVMDCSHASNETCIDVANLTTKPMVASHGNPAALRELGRNMSDEAMKAIASTGGVMCNVGVGLFMNPEMDSSPERLVEHVLYTANLVGKDKTCYATDYMHNAAEFFLQGVAQPEIFPPEKGYGAPASNIASEHVWSVVAILEEEHGWTEDEIRGYLGENLLRVYEANWK